MTLPDTPEAMRAHIEREGVAASPFTSFLGLFRSILKKIFRCFHGFFKTFLNTSAAKNKVSNEKSSKDRKTFVITVAMHSVSG